MKKTIYLSALLGLMLICKVNFSQNRSIPYYDNIQFNNNFFLLAESDAKSNYYVVDLSKFSTPFEKLHFQNLAFQERKLIRIDAGNANIAWFRVKKVFPEAEIKQIIIALKTQTSDAANTMSNSQKEQWLRNNGK